jgi:uncharacterized protein (TIGR02246 family)
MRKLWMILAVFGAMTVTWPAGAQSARQEIENTLAKFATAFNKGDATAVASFYTEDAALLPPGEARVDGRAAIEAYWKRTIDAGAKNLTLRLVEVGWRRDQAYEVGQLSIDVQDQSGKAATVKGKYVVIWKRSSDGAWRLFRDIWNTDPAPPAN